MEKVILTLGLAALLAGAFYMMQEQTTVPERLSIDSQIVDLYTEWKQQYGRKYASPEQDYYRLTVFNNNYNYIKNFFEGPEQTYTLGFNQFMDITNEEFVSTFLGLQVPETPYVPLPEEQEEVEPLRADVDWTTAGVLNAVRNQGSCGSCWAFSAVGAAEAANALAGKGLNAFSEQELVDCSTSYGNAGCNGGWMDSAFKYIIAKGISSRSAYPYVGKDQTCQRQNGTYRLTKFTDIAAGNCGSLETALAGRPVSVAVDATNWQFYSSGVFSNCATKLNHGVVLVGVTSTNWKIRNSWGTTWGESGHVRLAKGNTCGVCAAASYPTA